LDGAWPLFERIAIRSHRRRTDRGQAILSIGATLCHVITAP
jgi:hypothetical protein